jgi:thiosulfate/3-mercaptopyruvate sulfurtransferase
VDVTREELAARLGEPGLIVLDVRTPAEHAGQTGAPCDPRHGRIPGSRNVPVDHLFDLDAEAIGERLGASSGVEIVAYCHSGSRSAAAVHVLRAAGFDARNYVGSWHDWSRDESLPVETG